MFHEIKTFPFWCQKVLPLVYDESLSYYELLCKVVDYLNEHTEVINAHSEALEKLTQLVASIVDGDAFDDEIYQDVMKYIDQLWDDGTLSELVRQNPPMENYRCCGGWVGNNQNSLVAKNGQVLNISKTLEIANIAANDWVDINTSMTTLKEIPFLLDMPLQTIKITGSCNYRPYYIAGGDGIRHCAITFDVIAPKTGAMPTTIYPQLFISGRRAVVPSAPAHVYNASQGEYIMNCAKSYVTARENGRVFKYGANFTWDVDTHGKGPVNDAAGDAMIRCNALVLLALMGVPYGNSPYYNTTPSYEYNLQNLNVNTTDVPAAPAEWIKKVDNAWVNGYGNIINHISRQTWWHWDNENVFKDKEYARSGDIVMFRRLASASFDNVSHVGIIEKDANGDLWIIHATAGVYTDGAVVVRNKLTEDDYFALAPGRYKPEDMYFARLAYEGR